MDSLRHAVWEKMVDTDRLHRYHGHQASKFARQQRSWEVGLGFLGVMVAVAAVALTESGLVQTVAVGMALGALYPVIWRPGKRVVEAVTCARQLADLTDEWKVLWRQVNANDTTPETIELAVRALSTRTNAATAPMVQDQVDKRALEETEEETYAYWKKVAGAVAASPTGGKAITTT